MIVKDVFTNEDNVWIYRVDAVIMIHAMRTIFKLWRRSCLVIFITTIWGMEIVVSPLSQRCHNSLLVWSIPICFNARASRAALPALLQVRRTQRKKRYLRSVTDSFNLKPANKIFNTLELSDLTSSEIAISISWLKYLGPHLFPVTITSANNTVDTECGVASFG